MNSQLNQKKLGIQSSFQHTRSKMNALAESYYSEQRRIQELRDFVGRAFLSTKEYKNALTLWIKKGAEIWRTKEKAEDRYWRETIAKRLTTESSLAEIVCAGVKKPTSREWDDLMYNLNEAKKDPLMFLNLCGVRPLLVLEEIEGLRSGNQIDKACIEKLCLPHETEKIIETLSDLARAFDSIKFQMQACLNQIHRRARLEEPKSYESSPRKYKGFIVPEIFTPPDYLRAYKAILENRDEFIWVPQARKRGGQTQRFFNGLIAGLFELCMRDICQRLEGRHHPEERLDQNASRIGRRALDGAIAAIIYAVFPDSFHGKCSPKQILKKVRDAYKKSQRYIAHFN